MPSHPPAKLNKRHEAIALLVATGVSQAEISRQLGYSTSYLSVLCNSPLFLTLVDRYRAELVSNIVERIASLGPKSIDVAMQILERGKGSDQVSIIKEVWDRVAPKTTHSKEESVHRVIIDLEAAHTILAEVRDDPPIDITPRRTPLPHTAAELIEEMRAADLLEPDDDA